MFEGTTTEERFSVYTQITAGCQHLYSKNKPQSDKIVTALQSMYPLTQCDPVFLSHLAVWSVRQDSKDLQRTAIYVNAMSSGDSTPFVPGGTERKPNLRAVSSALLSSFNPKELSRLCYFRRLRWNNGETEAHHFPQSFRRAIANRLNSMSEYEIKRHVEHGFAEHLKHCYALIQAAPIDTIACLLRWDQKDGRTWSKELFTNPFRGLKDGEIVSLIRDKKVPFSRALSLLDRKPSAEILMGLFVQASPNQLIVNTKLFEEAGLLSMPEFAEKFFAKISEGNAVDRIDTLTKDVGDEKIKEKFSEARAKGRQKQFGELPGRMWLDIDVSISMKTAIDTAKEYAAIMCDVVGANQFEWGLVGTNGTVLQEKPETREKAEKVLFGVTASDGRSNLLYNYRAVQGGPNPVDYWVIITDGKINYGLDSLGDLPKPKSFSIVHVNAHVDENGRPDQLERFLKQNGIECNYIPVEALKESALVAQAIRAAVEGPLSIIDEIMKTPLPI